MCHHRHGARVYVDNARFAEQELDGRLVRVTGNYTDLASGLERYLAREHTRFETPHALRVTNQAQPRSRT